MCRTLRNFFVRKKQALNIPKEELLLTINVGKILNVKPEVSSLSNIYGNILAISGSNFGCYEFDFGSYLDEESEGESPILCNSVKSITIIGKDDPSPKFQGLDKDPHSSPIKSKLPKSPRPNKTKEKLFESKITASGEGDSDSVTSASTAFNVTPKIDNTSINFFNAQRKDFVDLERAYVDIISCYYGIGETFPEIKYFCGRLGAFRMGGELLMESDDRDSDESSLNDQAQIKSLKIWTGAINPKTTQITEFNVILSILKNTNNIYENNVLFQRYLQTLPFRLKIDALISSKEFDLAIELLRDKKLFKEAVFLSNLWGSNDKSLKIIEEYRVVLD